MVTIRQRAFRLLVLLGLSCILASGCGAPAPAPAVPTATPIPPVAATAKPIAIADAATAAPLPTVTLEAIIKGSFRKFTPNMGLPSGKITDLWEGTDGMVWLAAESGVYAGQQGFWQRMLDQPAAQILGSDGKGRVWVLLGDGGQIGYYDGTRWRISDKERGWEPLPALEYPSPGFGDAPATDSDGQVWFATGSNQVRRFESNTETWKTYTAEDMQYKPPALVGYQGHFLTSVVASTMGKVWVGDCIGEGEVLSGQGVRRLDGEVWNPAPPTADECVLDMAVDSSGGIWVAGYDKVQRYDPSTGAWRDYPLPEGRKALVTEIDLDREGAPWIEVVRAGGASQFGMTQRYHLVLDEWVMDYDPGMYSPTSAAFDQDNKAFLCSAGKVLMAGISATPLDFGSFDATRCEIGFDGSGKGWLLNVGGKDEGLWYFSP